MKSEKNKYSNFNKEQKISIVKLGEMKLILLFVFLLSTFASSFGQNKNILKDQLIEIINISINQKISFDTKSSKHDLYGHWYTNNNDNTFSKNDTVRLFNSRNIIEDSICHCQLKVLEFSKLNKFSQYSINKCKDEDSQMTQAETDVMNNIGLGKDWEKKLEKKLYNYIPHQYKFVEKSGDVFLVLFTRNKVFYSFKLEDIRNYNVEKLGKESYVITFIRQKG